VKAPHDFIIAGAGAAGLSLALRMVQSPVLGQRKILLLDRSAKSEADRTWCFWEKEPGLFQPILGHVWPRLEAFTPQGNALPLDLGDYQYKMIRSQDFYAYCKKILAQYPNVTWENADITGCSPSNTQATVHTTKGDFQAPLVFNSLPFAPQYTQPHHFYLQQHFMGWEIETTENVFDPQCARFMDFRTDQSEGTTFFYVLPTAPNRALIEYTFFSESILPHERYEAALKDYIETQYPHTAYQVLHQEFGVIPMSNGSFDQAQPGMLPIGLRAGWAKASTGYAFQNTQRETTRLVQALEKGETNTSALMPKGWARNKGLLYDGTLLRVLQKRQLDGADVFSQIMSQQPAWRMFDFLDDASSLLTDLRIMNSVPMGVFLPAALRQLLHWR
jgi:lycopene beta-cyclase